MSFIKYDCSLRAFRAGFAYFSIRSFEVFKSLIRASINSVAPCNGVLSSCENDSTILTLNFSLVSNLLSDVYLVISSMSTNSSPSFVPR